MSRPWRGDDSSARAPVLNGSADFQSIFHFHVCVFSCAPNAAPRRAVRVDLLHFRLVPQYLGSANVTERDQSKHTHIHIIGRQHQQQKHWQMVHAAVYLKIPHV